MNTKKFKEITNIDFDTFYKDNYERIKGFFYDWKVDNIDEIINDTFVKMLNNIEKFNPEQSSLRTYLYSIGRNELLMAYNKQKKEKDRLVYLDTYNDFTDEFSYTEKTDLDIDFNYLNFLQYLSTKNKNKRFVVEKKLQGFKYIEIDEMLNKKNYSRGIYFSVIYEFKKLIKNVEIINNRNVSIINIKTKKIYSSITILSKELGMKYITVYKRLLNNSLDNHMYLDVYKQKNNK